MLRPPRPRRLEAGLSPVASGGALRIILLRSQRTPGPARAAGASGHAAAAGNLPPLQHGYLHKSAVPRAGWSRPGADLPSPLAGEGPGERGRHRHCARTFTPSPQPLPREGGGACSSTSCCRADPSALPGHVREPMRQVVQIPMPLRQGRPQSGLRSVNAPRRSPSAKPRAASDGYSASIFALTSGFSVLPWQFRQTAAVGIAFR